MSDLVKRLREAVDALNAAIDDTHPEGHECDICRAADELDDVIAALDAQPVGLDGVRRWLSSRRVGGWSPGYSDDFKRGYDTAVEEVEAAALASEPQP